MQPPVVIIGAGITALSLAAQLEQAGIAFVVLEKSARVGGQIRTLNRDGFTFETGPNTGVISTPEVMELFEYVAPEATLQVARKAAAARWVWKGDRFHPLPSGLWSAVTTPLFAFGDKLRVLGEPWRKAGSDPLESVGDLTERRLGRSFVQYAVDPFLGGVYAGDPYSLTTQYALPKLYALERDHGSFVRGAIQKMKQPKSDRDRKATKEVFSAVGGLDQLVNGLVRKVSRVGRIELSVSDIALTPTSPGSWKVEYTSAQGEHHTLAPQHVVTTVRADQLPALFPADWHSLLSPITSLYYAPVTEVSVGYRHLPGVPREAFGGLVPSCEKRGVLGILFPSSCFDGRAPHADSALFTLFMGGQRQGDAYRTLSDEELIAIALRELQTMMRIPSHLTPDLVHLSRHNKAIPQYDKEMGTRWQRIAEIERAYPGLHLAGGMVGGIGLAHRITQGSQLGQQLAHLLSLPSNA